MCHEIRYLLAAMSLASSFAMSFQLVHAANSGTTEKRPLNVVFVVVDDLGWADLGCYGADLHETPHIDRLAQQGIRFTDAYAAAPICSPTRTDRAGLPVSLVVPTSLRSPILVSRKARTSPVSSALIVGAHAGRTPGSQPHPCPV